MVRFRVFDDEGQVDRFPAARAYLVGSDDIAVSGPVERQEMDLVGTPTTNGSVGLVTRVDLRSLAIPKMGGHAPASMPQVGRLTLQTCLLPVRETPYLLSLELARHRIMLFLNKLEDWQLFDLPAEHPVLVQFSIARTLFTDALVNLRNKSGELCRGAHDLAMTSLVFAIDAGESLALENAKRQLPDRLSGKAYAEATQAYTAAQGEAPPTGAPIVVQNGVGVTIAGRAALSCAVSPHAFTDQLKQAVIDSCDELIVPMNWIDLEPNEGDYSFASTDRWIEWAVRQARLPVVAGAVVDFAPKSIPEWMYIWENDYETLREVVYEHVKNVVTRYRRTVARWTIVSGLHVNTHFTLSYEQIMDLTRLCVLLVRRLQPKARVFLGLDQPWGEYFARHRQSLPPLLYADTVAQTGVVVDGYSIRLMMGAEDTGYGTRDLMAISSLLDRAAVLEKPIALSAVAAPSEQPNHSSAGAWRSGWDPEHQARWLESVLTIAAAKPYVQSVCWSDLIDVPRPNMPAGPPFGLIGADGKAKPAFASMARVRKAMREGKSPLDAIYAAPSASSTPPSTTNP